MSQTRTPSLSPLHNLMESGWSFALSYIDEEGEELVPQFLGQDDDGTISVYVCPWSSEDEKAWAIKEVAKHFAEHKVKRYVLLSEAYRAAYDKGSDGEMRPSEHPDREEVLMVLGVDPEAGEALQYFATITKDADGKRKVGDRDVIPMDNTIGGRMLELLGPFKPRTVQ